MRDKLRHLAQLVPLKFWILAAVLTAELEPLAVLPHSWHRGVLVGGPLIVFGVALLVFGWRKFSAVEITQTPIDQRFVFAHALMLALLASTEFALIRATGLSGAVELSLVWLRLAAILLLIASLFAAFMTGPVLWKLMGSLGAAWAYAALCTLLMLGNRWLTNMSWGVQDSRFGYAMQATCFAGTKWLLGIFYKHVVFDPATMTLGTERFSVQVSAVCSGIEGLGLMLAFAVCGLIYTRRELRLGRAALLIPFSLVTIWLLNMLRIAALVAIGDAGHEAVAVNGFHSEAGWILFNGVAIGFLFAATKLQWLQKDSFVASRDAIAEQRNVAVIYLLPFLAVLAASMLGRATSSGFDWLYPLRFVVACVVLWWFRAEYRKLDWRFGWMGVAAGAAIFTMWLGLSRWQHADGTVLAGQLATLTLWQRLGWISVRAVAAVVTVPIAEELAFRGYVARRVMSEDVETVAFARLSIPAMLVSSVLFGVMHGKMWIAGTIAGLVFAVVAKVRGRLGEAVAAHAVANLLIAVWVLGTGDLGMW